MQYQLYSRLSTGEGHSESSGGVNELSGRSPSSVPAGLERLQRLQEEFDSKSGPGRAPPRRSYSTTPYMEAVRPQPAPGTFGKEPVVRSSGKQQQRISRSTWPASSLAAPEKAKEPRQSRQSWYRGQNLVRIRVEALSSRATLMILLASYLALWLAIYLDSSHWLQQSKTPLSAADCSAAPASSKHTSACTGNSGKSGPPRAIAQGGLGTGSDEAETKSECGLSQRTRLLKVLVGAAKKLGFKTPHFRVVGFGERKRGSILVPHGTSKTKTKME